MPLESLRNSAIVRSPNVGRIELGVHLYQDLVDMLELAWVRQGESFEAATPWLRDTAIEETMERGRRVRPGFSTGLPGRDANGTLLVTARPT